MNDRSKRQAEAYQWALDCFGPEHSNSLAQRALRLVEEAIELCQACGTPADKVAALVPFIYSRPIGQIGQELGGVGLCALVLAAAHGIDADESEAEEFRRVLAKPRRHFTERNAAKNAAGFDVTPITERRQRTEDRRKTQGGQSDRVNHYERTSNARYLIGRCASDDRRQHDMTPGQRALAVGLDGIEQLSDDEIISNVHTGARAMGYPPGLAPERRKMQRRQGVLDKRWNVPLGFSREYLPIERRRYQRRAVGLSEPLRR